MLRNPQSLDRLVPSENLEDNKIMPRIRLPYAWKFANGPQPLPPRTPQTLHPPPRGRRLRSPGSGLPGAGSRPLGAARWLRRRTRGRRPPRAAAGLSRAASVPLATPYTSASPGGARCASANRTVGNYSFGTRQQRQLFPLYHPPDLTGNKFLPLRGSPHRGPGCYVSDRYDLAYNLSKIPTSIKGYALGARTAVRFKPIEKDMTPYPGMYQRVSPREEKHKQSFAPFNALVPRFRKQAKDPSYPGPGTYYPERRPPPKIAWPMRFGSPDWAQVPCLQKRTLKAELSTDKDFRKHRNRVAYLSLYYN
ncbi:protein pitchfork [Carlito syrichta]|uniref:Protein pitchfork n=1 Tax=Carlito syrichta TaxID=1868482 RepID=A0A3Q0EHW3_CARSF|nr:protein pitchfork [Carlito syrichta]